MILLLKLGQAQGPERLRTPIESASLLSCRDVAAVEHLPTVEPEEQTTAPLVEVGWLGRYTRPLPVIDAHDRLLAVEGSR
jgi:hypothetical protein